MQGARGGWRMRAHKSESSYICRERTHVNREHMPPRRPQLRPSFRWDGHLEPCLIHFAFLLSCGRLSRYILCYKLSRTHIKDLQPIRARDQEHHIERHHRDRHQERPQEPRLQVEHHHSTAHTLESFMVLTYVGDRAVFEREALR